MSEVAVKYLRQAGERAAARSANREAATLFEQALGVLDELPETPGTLGATIDMHIALGSALIPIKGPGAAEVEISYLRARELVERLGDATRLYPTLWGLWFSNYARGSYSTARELADQLLEVAASRDDGDQLLEAHHALWATLFAMGDPASALPHLEQGLSLYDPVRHGSPPFLYGGHDPGTCGHYHVARIQWLLGYPDRAAVALRRAVDLADALAHPLSTVLTLTTAAFIKDQLGDRESARRDAERAAAVAKGHEFAAWTDDSGVLLACLAARGSGDGQRASEVSSRLRTTPGPFAFRQVLNLSLLAATFAEIGDVDKGLAALSAIPDEHRGTVYAPEIQRIHGELLKRRGDRVHAEKCFRNAIDIARRRAERSLELRAAMSLARLLKEADQDREAHQVLAPVYASFTEGFDTADLRAAKTLLDDTA